MMKFVNRAAEFAALEKSYKKHGFMVCYGRRRVGKTKLVTQWLADKPFVLYSQAIVSAPHLQLEQVFEDIRSYLKTNIVPKSWNELFEILGHVKSDLIFCIDEFPYLVAQDPSLPSLFQKWIDHSKGRVFLILSGSSQRMMHDLFLKSNAPLYGRADTILHVKPMSFDEFIHSTGIDKCELSFILFSMVGGVPKYWESVENGDLPSEFASKNFFASGSVFEPEPDRILADEGVNGVVAKAVLDAIGKGSHKLSEIAARLQTPASNLTRVTELLRDASLIEREVPFGESTKTTKRSLYKISDPCLRFWYNVYSPHISRWHLYSETEKNLLIRGHASTVLEDVARSRFPHSQRYWEGGMEFDCVYLIDHKKNEIGIIEAKFGKFTKNETKSIEDGLREKFEKSQLAQKYMCKTFRLFTVADVLNYPCS